MCELEEQFERPDSTAQASVVCSDGPLTLSQKFAHLIVSLPTKILNDFSLSFSAFLLTPVPPFKLRKGTQRKSPKEKKERNRKHKLKI